MKEAKLSQVLDYYDGPQIFEAVDSIGGHYLGLAVNAPEHSFLVVGASPERLRQFRGGTIDLLSLIIDRPDDVGWQLGSFVEGRAGYVQLTPPSFEPIKPEHLPSPGFVLRKSQAVSDLVKEAQERNGLVMEVTLDPPEAVTHRINSETLGQFLLVFQRMLKYAFRAWAKKQPAGYYSPSGYNFAVTGIKPGSVRIELQAEQAANLFGSGESRPAVETVLSLIASAANPEEAVQVVAENKGHLASAFVNLLDVLIDSRTRMQVDWADGISDVVTSATITQDEAKNTRTRLGLVNHLHGEQRTVRGVLKKVDVNRGTWRLEAGKETVSGRCSDEGPSLSHLETDSAYAFVCTEVIELSPAGRESTVLYLDSIEKA